MSPACRGSWIRGSSLSAEAHSRIRAAIDGLRDGLERVATDIHARPELRFEERYAADRLTGELEQAGLSVARGTGGLETAFRAELGSGAGPKIGILFEYDALPAIGHACGHNLIAAGALGAVLGLRAVADELPGTIVALGTPAEEGGGGKIKLIEAGAMADLDAAMMFHPLDRDYLWMPALACDEVQFDFTGHASHAAGAPWDGRSALSGVIQTFNLIDGARVHFRDGVRVHGFVTDGGVAVNIVPDHAGCRFSVRARTAAELDVVRARVLDCARGAALATQTEIEITVETGYRDIRNNRPMFERFGRHFTGAGGGDIKEPPANQGIGSTDMGDVSHVVPAIHPYVAICDEGAATCHMHAFADAAASPRGVDAMIIAAKAMACTAHDLLTEPSLLGATRDFFESGRSD